VILLCYGWKSVKIKHRKQVDIENVEKMPQSTFEEIIEKYVEMNIMGSIILERWRNCLQDI